MSKELYSEGLKHLSSILLKAQGRPDAETNSNIDIGYECMRLLAVLDGMNGHSTTPQKAKPEGYAYEKAKRWSRGEFATLSAAKEEVE